MKEIFAKDKVKKDQHNHQHHYQHTTVIISVSHTRKQHEIPNTMISLAPTASNISRCILMCQEIYSATTARAQWSLRYEVQVKKQQEEH